jgi:hypothetical protein
MTEKAVPRNRHERRQKDAHDRRQAKVWSKNFAKVAPESIPRADNDTLVATCDWPGCGFEWGFVTMGTIHGVRKPIARRCAVHRLG